MLLGRSELMRDACTSRREKEVETVAVGGLGVKGEGLGFGSWGWCAWIGARGGGENGWTAMTARGGEGVFPLVNLDVVLIRAARAP